MTTPLLPRKRRNRDPRDLRTPQPPLPQLLEMFAADHDGCTPTPPRGCRARVYMTNPLQSQPPSEAEPECSLLLTPERSLPFKAESLLQPIATSREPVRVQWVLESTVSVADWTACLAALACLVLALSLLILVVVWGGLGPSEDLVSFLLRRGMSPVMAVLLSVAVAAVARVSMII
jgi:hypothetical protein